MASFDENGKYIKTNWKAGDKITSTKLNKIEESIEAVNDNDISRHVEADARLDALEAKDVARDKELTKIKNDIADNKAAAELGDYDINSRMQFLEQEFNEGIEALNEGIEEVHNVAETVDGKIATAEANMSNAVNTAKTEMTTQVNTAKTEMTTQVNTAKTEMTTQVNTAKTEMTTQVNQGKADMEAMVNDVVDAITPIASDLSSSISEELTNNSVTSFKVGTSNVNGADLSNQMEQSLVDITYIKGNVIDRDGKFNPVVVNFDSGEKELHSLQDRFYDEYKDGKLYKRIKKLTNKDFVINNIERGSNAGWNESGNTYGFYIRKIGDDCIDITSIDCNLFRYNEGLVDNDIPGVSISAEYSWIGFRVNKTTLGITSGDTDSAKLEKTKEWFKRTYIEVYYLVNETIIDESITMLANPNEEINVVSGTPTTIKHAIQLNTKSQIEETQKQIIKSNKSIWQSLKELTEKVKEFTDVEMKIQGNGYIKLPTALGGLVLQWFTGEVTLNAGSKVVTKSIKYPFACSEFSRCIATVRSSSAGAYTDFTCSVIEGTSKDACMLEIRRADAYTSNINISATIFVIGK